MTYLLFLMLLCYEALACIDPPDNIKLSGSSFAGETFSVGRSRQAPRHNIQNGDSDLWHNGTCWILEVKEKPMGCINKFVDEENEIVLYDSDSNNKKNKIGVLEFKDSPNKLWVFSVDSEGRKDLNKPYLVFEEHLQDNGEKAQLTATAYERGRVIGQYESEQEKFSKYRSLAVPKALPKGTTTSAFDVRGKDGISAGCYGIKVKDFNSSDSRHGSQSSLVVE